MAGADDKVELHPIARALSHAFAVHDGLLVMTPEDAATHLAAVQAVHDDERELLATHLVALAHRLREQAGETAEGAIALLIAFTVAALGEENADKAADMFANAGLGKEAANAIGSAQNIKAPRAEDAAKPASAAPKLKRGLKRD
jgi:hypothetical protein